MNENKNGTEVNKDVRPRVEDVKRAILGDLIIKKAIRIGKSSIYINMTGLVKDNEFYKIRKEGENLILTKVDLDVLSMNLNE